MALNRAEVNEILELMEDNRSISNALKLAKVKASAFFKALREYPDLQLQFDDVQSALSEQLVDEMLQIADSEPDPNRARNRIHVRQWYASKMKPRKFGEKLDINMNQTVDLKGALAEARSRVVVAVTQPVINTARVLTQNTGIESVSSQDAIESDLAKLLE
ncbi:MAG TPA: hypothetical protein PKW79_00150 [Rhabdochlamydiaceae bacterium]|nr:hypothetical protein [Rhabdochlamydiaceae bacterium]